MYDKYGCVLRIETTINDVSFFKHHHKAEHRQGPPTRVLAPVKKTIYSLIDLREIMLGCNRRYLAHLAALDDFSAGVRALDRLTKPRTVEHKTLKGINFFDPVDNALLHALQNPRVNIAGIPIASHASFAGPATSAYSSGSLEPIATTSPASAAPRPQRPAVLLRP